MVVTVCAGRVTVDGVIVAAGWVIVVVGGVTVNVTVWISGEHDDKITAQITNIKAVLIKKMDFILTKPIIVLALLPYYIIAT